ncbi:MAG: hypothetical protein N4A59_04445 [Marinifilum sp.]|jgi:hypothetical protein|nr:hypothetical protein [Marinifilum sp.]
MYRLIFTSLLILFSLLLKANNLAPSKTEKDTLYKPNYPEGIYVTKKDFINKSPSSFEKIISISQFKNQDSLEDSIYHCCYFYYLKDKKKVKNVFAISFKKHLFFQTKAILKNRNKFDRAQSTNYHNTFVRVIMGGNNYLYTEAELVNQWAAGAAANFGVAGGVILNDIIRGKGIVWDFKNNEFNIFKSCKDYNKFIKDKYPNGVQEVVKHQPNMLEVRKAIEIIK